eukprot:TRINITY_DN27306_c0_g1_i1.p1 TRINITY_DN27306_c0_g1~~TRINITY_DN27306_c0_g1_i1.p1  ORF type:complete len:334 (+),score=50.94 TRINITY_DN27306_c0_g1_i1:91-1092(+)
MGSAQSSGCLELWDFAQKMGSSGPQAALRISAMAAVTEDCSGARLTGFQIDDEVALLRMANFDGFKPLGWRSTGFGSQGSGKSRPPPGWIRQQIPTEPRFYWHGVVLSCDPHNTDKHIEHVCLIQTHVDSSCRQMCHFDRDLLDSWSSASYAHRFNMHLKRQSEGPPKMREDGIIERSLAKGVKVAIPVTCEVLGSTTPQFLAAGDHLTVTLFPLKEVQKFVYDGQGDFEEMPQSFFHYASSNSGGKEMLWDLQGCKDESGEYLLVNPHVHRRPQASVTDIITAVAAGAGSTAAGPRPQQFDALHPKCTPMCETFDPNRAGAHGRGMGFSCAC